MSCAAPRRAPPDAARRSACVPAPFSVFPCAHAKMLSSYITHLACRTPFRTVFGFPLTHGAFFVRPAIIPSVVRRTALVLPDILRAVFRFIL